ncbi:hypothetical protein ACHWQZ_G010338 [Mnemiopsis leidyi]
MDPLNHNGTNGCSIGANGDEDKLSQQELAIESLTKKPEVSMTPREAVNSNLIDELNKSEKENKWLQDKFSNVQRVNKSIQLEQAK